MSRRRVLLLGWDAADWKIIHPLLDAGKLPYLERLVNAGTIGNLATLQPVLSPILWNTIATGKYAEKHGILGFVEPRPDGAGIRPVTSTSRTCKALWNILSERGRRACVVNWYASHPAERIDGVVVTNQVEHAAGTSFEGWPLPPAAVAPESYREVVADLRLHPSEVGAEQILAMVPRAAEVDQDKDRRLATIAKLLAEFGTVHAIGTYLAEHEGWDLLAVYYDSIDHFGHGFMGYRPPPLAGISERDCAIYGEVVDHCYRLHDLALGRYMELLGPETTIVICSDHGFHSDHLRPPARTTVDGEGFSHQHRDYGILAACGPGIRRDARIYGASLLDITPTVLHLLGLPVARDMDGRALTRLLEDPVEPEMIETYEGPEPSPVETVAEGADPWSEAEAMRQLAELGYIESPGEQAAQAIARAQAQRHANLGTLYFSRGEYARAAEAFERMDRFASFAPARARLALCYLRLGQIERSRGIIDEVLAAQPDSPYGHYVQGQLLALDGREAEALEHLREAERGGADAPRLALALGMLYLRQRQWADAERVLGQALEADPEDARALHGLGVALYQQGRYAESVARLLASVALLHHQPLAHHHLGFALAATGRLRWAVRAHEVALELAPRMAAAHRRLALLHRHLGEEALAAEHEGAAAEGEVREDAAMPGPAEARDGGDREVLEASLPEPRVPAPPGEGGEPPVVVSGLPRSGTSMMMQMLAAGGLEVLADGARGADQDNPRGYLEYAPVAATARDPGWVEEAAGKAVKVIAPLLGALPADRTYRVILMRRAITEVVASQARMLARQGRAGARIDADELAATYRGQLERIRGWLRREPRFAVLEVDYAETLVDPGVVASRVAAFLERELETAAMAAAVDPRLRRQRG